MNQDLRTQHIIRWVGAVFSLTGMVVIVAILLNPWLLYPPSDAEIERYLAARDSTRAPMPENAPFTFRYADTASAGMPYHQILSVVYDLLANVEEGRYRDHSGLSDIPIAYTTDVEAGEWTAPDGCRTLLDTVLWEPARSDRATVLLHRVQCRTLPDAQWGISLNHVNDQQDIGVSGILIGVPTEAGLQGGVGPHPDELLALSVLHRWYALPESGEFDEAEAGILFSEYARFLPMLSREVSDMRLLKEWFSGLTGDLHHIRYEVDHLDICCEGEETLVLSYEAILTGVNAEGLGVRLPFSARCEMRRAPQTDAGWQISGMGEIYKGAVPE